MKGTSGCQFNYLTITLRNCGHLLTHALRSSFNFPVFCFHYTCTLSLASGGDSVLWNPLQLWTYVISVNKIRLHRFTASFIYFQIWNRSKPIWHNKFCFIVFSCLLLLHKKVITIPRRVCGAKPWKILKSKLIAWSYLYILWTLSSFHYVKTLGSSYFAFITSKYRRAEAT